MLTSIKENKLTNEGQKLGMYVFPDDGTYCY